MQPSAASRLCPREDTVCVRAGCRDTPVTGLSCMNPCSPGLALPRLPHPLASLMGLANEGHRKREPQVFIPRTCPWVLAWLHPHPELSLNLSLELRVCRTVFSTMESSTGGSPPSLALSFLLLRALLWWCFLVFNAGVIAGTQPHAGCAIEAHCQV